jgi:hypothetical protein
MIQVLQRPDSHGTPIQFGAPFILKKNRREAKALLFSHVFGWEVRLVIGAQPEVVQMYRDTEVCATGRVQGNRSFFPTEIAPASAQRALNARVDQTRSAGFLITWRLIGRNRPMRILR